MVDTVPRVTALLMLLVFSAAVAAAQSPSLDQEMIRVVVEDILGRRVEGYLQPGPKEVTVSTKDHQEKTVPVQMIESIKLEKIQGRSAGSGQDEAYYSVRMKNSQELFALRDRYTLSLVTDIGVVTKTIDPDSVREVFGKDPSSPGKPQSGQPFVRDRSVVFSLEFRF